MTAARALTPAERADVEKVTPLIIYMVAKQVRKMPAYVDRGDLQQAALEAVCRARMRWDPGVATFSTFAVFRAHGAVQDYLRQQRAGTRANPQDEPISIDQAQARRARSGEQVSLLDTLQAPEHDHSHMQLLRQVARELERMSERDARTFRLVALEGMRLQDVAALDGVTESAIYLRLRRARARLQPLAAAA